MKKYNIYSLVSIALVIVWMIIVFLLSNQVSEESSETSGDTIRTLIHLFNNEMDIQKENELVGILQPIARKCAHFTLYTLGGILLYNCTIQITKRNQKFNNIKRFPKIFAIGIGFFYACTDELHQLFVLGRSCEMRDVVIDTCGIILGVYVLFFTTKFISKHKTRR